MSFKDFGYELLVGASDSSRVDAEKVLDDYNVQPGTSVFQEDILGVPAFLWLSHSPAVLARASEILGGKVVPYYSHILITGKGGIPATSNWHKDNMPKKGLAVKAHFYLSDVESESSGPMELAPGSWENLNPPTHGVQTKFIYASRGDVVLTRPDLWHRSTRVATNAHTRKTVHVSYRLAD